MPIEAPADELDEAYPLRAAVNTADGQAAEMWDAMGTFLAGLGG